MGGRSLVAPLNAVPKRRGLPLRAQSDCYGSQRQPAPCEFRLGVILGVNQFETKLQGNRSRDGITGSFVGYLNKNGNFALRLQRTKLRG